MYLVDTSVWIGLFREQDTAAVRAFRRLIERGVPFGLTGVILQEILQGAKTERDFRLLNRWLRTQRFWHPRDALRTHEAAARLFFDCRRNGITIRSTLDCLIAQIAIEHNLILLHDDADYPRIATVASKLKLADA